MSVTQSSPPCSSGPAWEIARLFPEQGCWDESDYLELTDHLNYLVELDDGCIEVLPMPTASHQNIGFFLLTVLRQFITPRKLGFALGAPFRIHLGTKRFREPDVCFMRRQNADRMSDRYWKGADLVMEVVSGDPKDRERDFRTKRLQYARAGIVEYWIIDPEETHISVLKLVGKKYIVHSEGSSGGRITSALLPGFELEVDAVFAAAAFPE